MSEDAHGKEWDEQHPHICVPGEEEIHEEPTTREEDPWRGSNLEELLLDITRRLARQDRQDGLSELIGVALGWMPADDDIANHFRKKAEELGVDVADSDEPPRNCMTCGDCEHARPDSGGPFGTDYVCSNEHVCAGYVAEHKRATLHIVNIDGEPVAFVGPDYGCVHMMEEK